MSIKYNIDISQTLLAPVTSQYPAYNPSTSYNLNDKYSIDGFAMNVDGNLTGKVTTLNIDANIVDRISFVCLNSNNDMIISSGRLLFIVYNGTSTQVYLAGDPNMLNLGIDGNGTNASFSSIDTITVDSNDNIYVIDRDVISIPNTYFDTYSITRQKYCIRKIDLAGNVTTIASNISDTLNYITCDSSNNIYAIGQVTNVIVKMDHSNYNVTTFLDCNNLGLTNYYIALLAYCNNSLYFHLVNDDHCVIKKISLVDNSITNIYSGSWNTDHATNGMSVIKSGPFAGNVLISTEYSIIRYDLSGNKSILCGDDYGNYNQVDSIGSYAKFGSLYRSSMDNMNNIYCTDTPGGVDKIRKIELLPGSIANIKSSIFSGYFLVDSNTNVISAFYNNVNPSTNIIVFDYDFNAGYSFVNGTFTDGTNFTSLSTAIDASYGATEWQLLYDSTLNKTILFYKDSNVNWINILQYQPNLFTVNTSLYTKPQNNIVTKFNYNAITRIKYNIDISKTVPVQYSPYNQATSYILNDKYSISDANNISYSMIVDGSLNCNVSEVNGLDLTQINNPNGICFTSNNDMIINNSGNLYIVYNGTSTLVNLAGSYGNEGIVDGDYSTARLFNSTNMAINSNNDIYILDNYNYTNFINHTSFFTRAIRKVDLNGNVTTVAGRMNTNGGYVDANGANARFSDEMNLCFDSNDNLYMTSNNHNVIRKMDTNYNVSTILNGLTGYIISSLTHYNNSLYILFIDSNGYTNCSIKKMSLIDNTLSDVYVGSWDPNDNDCYINVIKSGQFAGNILIGTQNHIIQIDLYGNKKLICGKEAYTGNVTNGIGTSASFGYGYFFQLDNMNNLYFYDWDSTLYIRKVEIIPGSITTTPTPQPNIVFNGYLLVDSNTNVIIEFHNNNVNPSANIIAVTGNDYGADYVYVNGNFTEYGTAITSISNAVDLEYGATEWSLWYDGNNINFSYKDSVGVWHDLPSSIFSVNAYFLHQIITPQKSQQSQQPFVIRRAPAYGNNSLIFYKPHSSSSSTGSSGTRNSRVKARRT